MNARELFKEYEKNPSFEKYQELMNNPTFKNFLFNHGPEDFNMPPEVFHKTTIKTRKIYDFWKNHLPKEFFELILNDYYISESAITVGSEFLGHTKKDYKNYPWIEKILAKRKELFGF